MHSELTTEEIFQLLSKRFYQYYDSGMKNKEGNPYDADAHNALVSILKDFTGSFSEGRLKVVAAPEPIKVSCSSLTVCGDVTVDGEIAVK